MLGGVPIVNLPSYYIRDMKITNNATTPNTQVDVSAGICRDNDNKFDINLGNFGGIYSGMASNTSNTIDATANGANGLDTGALGANKLYYVYVIGDARTANLSKCILSLAAPSVGPLMPSGYNVYRHIGYMFTGAGSTFLKCYNAGNGNAREFKYDAPVAGLAAGNAVAFTAVALTNKVPLVEDTPVMFSYSFLPGAASRTANISPGNGVGNGVTITGQVTAVAISGNVEILSKVTASVPEVDYKVANAGDALTLLVAGFKYYL